MSREESSIVRPAHENGYSDICFNDDGQYLVSCGEDGDVILWHGVEDDDPTHVNISETTHAVAVKGSKLLVANEENFVYEYKFPEMEQNGILCRFTAPATHIAFSDTSTFVAIGSRDFTIKLVTVEDRSYKILSGHQAPILSVAYDPQEDYLASASCDGLVKIWRTTDKMCLETIDILEKCNDFEGAKSLCRLKWQPKSGKILAIPVQREIRMYERTSWNLLYTLSDVQIQQCLSVVVWSQSSECILSTDIDGCIYVWNLNSKSCIVRSKHKRGYKICCATLHPTENELVFTDVRGNIGSMEGLFPDPKQKTSAFFIEESVEKDDSLFGDDDDDDIVGAAEIGVNDGGISPIQAIDDDDDSNENAISLSRIKAALAPDLDDEDEKDLPDFSNLQPQDNAMASMVPYTGPKITEQQPPFQPGSTPLHLSNRFMVWNLVGIVRSYEDDDASIDVEFHDSSTHHSIHLTNNMNYTMADLSSEAVLLASGIVDDSPSTLMCYHFNTWDNNKEWTVSMPDNEEIQAICIGDGWVCASTNRRILRIFTLGGLQYKLLSTPGPVVCLCGQGDQLALYYHHGLGVEGDQFISVLLVHVLHRSHSVTVPVALTAESKLRWASFSLQGTPVTADSSGVVRLLNRSIHQTWTPIADTSIHCKSKSDHYWVVGVNETPQQLRAIYCKGFTFPLTLPKPVMNVLPFQLPLCDVSSEKTQLENSLCKSQVFTQHIVYMKSTRQYCDDHLLESNHKDQLEAVMKLFALACKSGKDYKAAELCELFLDEHGIALAIKYASHLKNMALAQKLNEIARKKSEQTIIKDEDELMEQEPQKSMPCIDDSYNHTNTEFSLHEAPELVKPNRYHAAHAPRLGNRERYGEEKLSGEQLSDNDVDTPDVTPQPVYAVSGQRNNPFKISSQRTVNCNSVPSLHGSSVFDSMKVIKEKEKKQPMMPEMKPKKLQLKKRRSKPQENCIGGRVDAEDLTKLKPRESENNERNTAFRLWFAEYKSILKNENPNKSADELYNLGLEQWSAISITDKQEWCDKMRAEENNANKGKSAENKRKRDPSTDTQPTITSTMATSKKSKQGISEMTNTILDSFRFGNTS